MRGSWPPPGGTPRRWWLHATRSDPGLDAGRWRRTEPAVAEGGMISLRGLPRLVVAEVLYGLQRRCAEGIRTHRTVLRPLCDDLRRTQAGSIAGLSAQGRRQRRDLLRSLADHCRVGLSSPDAEQAKDVWDLRVLGHRGSLDFTVIELGWLRAVVRRWAAENLPPLVTRPCSAGATSSLSPTGWPSCSSPGRSASTAGSTS